MSQKSHTQDYGACAKLPALIIFVFASVLVLSGEHLQAKPVGDQQARKVVKGWLKLDPKPLRTPLGNKISTVDVFIDDNGQPVYYVVYLQPSGFVIVPADDLVEPIIAFADDGTFEPSEDNPLGALVRGDLPGRINTVRELQEVTGTQKHKKLTGPQAALQKVFLKAQDKWNKFHAASDGKIKVAGLPSISDVRVAPLIESEWGQTWVCIGSWDCYNYYTPSNYPSGCVATAMAQLMRYHQHPTSGVGTDPCTIKVNGSWTTRNLRGGNGSGGPYSWGQMVLAPESNCGSVTLSQRQAIGALCHDAGVSMHTEYSSGSSAAMLYIAREVLPETFDYSNAINGFDGSDLSGPGLNGMVNPNLDAGYPALLGIRHILGGYGHAVVTDGYGYNSSTLYHHLNMGWEGIDDAWYNLPTIEAYYDYDTVEECIYNIYTSGTGEIISGRVTDDSNNPISGATVTANRTGGGTYNDTTDSNGIYALSKVPSSSTYTVSVTKSGYTFTNQGVTTGTSTHDQGTSGNKWGIDFVGTPPVSGGCSTVTIGTGTSTWGYPMYTYYHDSRTQVIYLAAEIGDSGNISELTLYVEAVPGYPLNNWTIRMKHTSMSSYSTASLDANGWTTVYHANEPVGSTGWRTFTFSTPFEYNGTDNLLVDFSHNSDDYDDEGMCRYSTPGGTRTAYARSDSDDDDPLDWSGTSSPFVYNSTKVPNVQLTICNDIAGDFDGDGDVDIYDLDTLVLTWLNGLGDGNWNPDCDICQPTDDFIDFSDFAVFGGNWQVGVE